MYVCYVCTYLQAYICGHIHTYVHVYVRVYSVFRAYVDSCCYEVCKYCRSSFVNDNMSQKTLTCTKAKIFYFKICNVGFVTFPTVCTVPEPVLCYIIAIVCQALLSDKINHNDSAREGQVANPCTTTLEIHNIRFLLA